MKICIVGHGTSISGKSYGTVIDEHDVVVRLKNCSSILGTPDYGSKATVQVASVDTPGIIGSIRAEMYWIYTKAGKFDPATVGEAVGKVQAPVWMPVDLAVHWNKHFVEIGGKHPCVSIGTAAFFMAAHFFQPEQITMAGFDTVMAGGGDGQSNRTKAVPRTGTGIIPHDWATERKFLEVVADTYQFNIAVLGSVEEHKPAA